MIDKEDKYADSEEDLTQVRNIIKQLSDEKPSRERHREVVVRADGTKVVRVTKKRKVMMSAREKHGRSRRRFIYLLAGAFVVFVMMVAFLFIRMASMSTSSYLEECQQELQQRWGAASLQIEGAGINGTSLQLSHIVAEFPESSMVERVELGGIEASLDWLSFFTSRIIGDEVKMERALIVLRTGARMKMPLFEGESMWRFNRMDCKDLTVQFAEGEEGPAMLKNTQAYLYYPHAAGMSCVVMLKSGALALKGWKTINITESKAHLSTRGVDDFTLQGTTDSVVDIAEQRRTSIALAGKIASESDFRGPYAVETDNMSLADFTRGRFEEFFTARTRSTSQGRISNRATVTLAGEGKEPEFNGEFHLQNLCLSSFPALMAITEHIEPAKRRFYNPLSLQRGYVVIETQEGTISLDMPEGAVVERDIATLKGKVSVNEANELAGELYYGVPMLLARAEYPDGMPDPIFQQAGDWAVLRTRLRGQGNVPQDDMAEVEARAVQARRERPARIPFSELDIDKLTEQMKKSKDDRSIFEGSGIGNGLEDSSKADDPFRNPFETSSEPFGAPSAPF